jgi:hypothetical protein
MNPDPLHLSMSADTENELVRSSQEQFVHYEIDRKHYETDRKADPAAALEICKVSP